MPTVYLDRPFLDFIRDRCEQLERKEARERDEQPKDIRVPEKEGLESMLADEEKETLERYREQHN
jgi:hypothetical protein